MRKSSRFCSVFAAFLTAFHLFGSTALAADEPAVLCRMASFVGLERRTESIHTLLGENTTNPSEIKLFVGKDGGTTYIQSNFLSEDPDNPGTYSEHPTKIRTNEARDLPQALQKIIFWGNAPLGATEFVSKALASTHVYLDRSAIDQNGRISVDLSGAKSIALVTDNQTLTSGRIDTIRLKEPPPALVETIDGCCFKGRPPGRATEIVQKLSERKINNEKTVLLSLVVDSGTESVISKSGILSAASKRASYERTDSWEVKINKSMKATRGTTMVILSHIEGADAAVLDPSGNKLFSIPVKKLRELAQKSDVDLILFGCDTASFINENSDSIGVVGKYNTATAAKRLAVALPNSKNVAQLLKAIASPELTIVAYDELGGNGFAGASGFAKVKNTGFLARVFRVLSIRGKG